MQVLAFDFGASSGRAMLVGLHGGKLDIKEIHRFSNVPVFEKGTMYWDFDTLFAQIKTAIKIADTYGFCSIGIDTWGVDFGLIGKDGNLLERPVHYRDIRTDNMPQKVFEKIGKRELYNQTGIQTMKINTIFQLYYLATQKRELLEQADKFLMMPDLFMYFLTGEKKCEYTNASTTGLLDIKTGFWHNKIIDILNLPRNIFPAINQPATLHGMLSQNICKELGVKNVPVYSVCTHDTASAVVAFTGEENCAYISCGTWSLLGVEITKPNILESAYNGQLTNEGGFDHTIRFLKNIMGLWIIQECKRQWDSQGTVFSYSEIMAMAEKEKKDEFIIDVDDEMFLNSGNMPAKIAEYFQKQNIAAPDSIAKIARCIYDSLAKKYRYELDSLSKITGTKYQKLNIIGGGSNASLLCQLTADVCGIEVIAGPSEATVIGNAVVQLIANGQINDIKEARQIILESIPTKKYYPANKFAHR